MIPYAAHTRANTRIDRERLMRALAMDPSTTSLRSFIDEDANPLDPSASFLNNMRDRWFGLINPFSVDWAISEYEGLELSLKEIVQVFDLSLFLPGGFPDTVMTNIGDRTRAMELTPGDLIGAIRAVSGLAEIQPIASPCPIWLGQAGKHRKDVFMNWPPPQGPRIGILTGNGPESGLYLWQHVISAVRKIYPKVPDVFMPDVVIHSAPEMGLSMELASRENAVREIVVRGIKHLLEADCKLVTVACNTTIYFEEELTALCSRYGARFVSIAEAAIPAVSRALATRPSGEGVGLIGIGSVIDIEGAFSGYRRHLEDAGISVTTCAADEFAFDIKNEPEKGSRATAFERLVARLPATAGVVIIALTEASIVYPDYSQRRSKKRPDPRVYVDAVAELGAYMAFNYLATGYAESEVCQITDMPTTARKLRERLGWLVESG
ncbi:MAG TPA: hypothetical protein VLJ80_00865 [Solirubrobacteraceae bacterium]|nr:hypothetical protein [Solirubrobacteraceae bacterium]